jgi:hypothetical protein
MLWAHTGDDPFSLTHFPYHALHTRSIPWGPRPAQTRDSHQNWDGGQPGAASVGTAFNLTCYPHSKRPPSQQPMGESDPDASPPPTVRVANRNMVFGSLFYHTWEDVLTGRKCSFHKAVLTTASVQPLGSANFPVALLASASAPKGSVWTAPWRTAEGL